MPEPIIEQIAQWLESAIADVTEANGYQQTLSVKRPEDRYITPESITDLSATIYQSDCEEERGPDIDEPVGDYYPQIYWLQEFVIYVDFFAQAGDELSMDNRINRAAADIYKRIGVEVASIRTNHGRLCGGLASWIALMPPSIELDRDINSTVLMCPVQISYNFDRDNPYSQHN
jgi:hypothetical protein